jgi:hypothetical protein
MFCGRFVVLEDVLAPPRARRFAHRNCRFVFQKYFIGKKLTISDGLVQSTLLGGGI